jgi:hypothetical protein
MEIGVIPFCEGFGYVYRIICCVPYLTFENITVDQVTEPVISLSENFIYTLEVHVNSTYLLTRCLD